MHGDHSVHAGADTDTWGWVLVAAVAVVPVVLYLVGVARRRRNLRRGWPPGRTAAFILGALLVAAAISPPVSDFAHSDARGHMVQHLLLGMYAPVALVLSAPVRVVLGASPPRVRGWIGGLLRSRLVHLLAHPITAGVLNVGGLYLLYVTPLYALSMQNPIVHVLVIVHFLAAGYLFAWSIAGPDPAPRRPGMTMRVVAFGVSVTAHAYLAKLLYGHAGEWPPGVAYAVSDMQQAAQWMYYGGELAELALATALFSAWYRSGRPARRRSVVPAGSPEPAGAHG